MTAKVVPYKAGFGPFAPEVYRAPAPYPFRGVSEDDAIDGARAALQGRRRPGVGRLRRARAGAGRGRLHPDAARLPARACSELLDAARDPLRRRRGAVAACGRTGPVWAIEHYGVEPDLLVSGKSLGGGLPLAAVTGRAEVMDAVAARRARRHLRRQPASPAPPPPRSSTSLAGAARRGPSEIGARLRERLEAMAPARSRGARARPDGRARARRAEPATRRRAITRAAREQGLHAPLVRALRQRDPDPRAVHDRRRRARARARHPGAVACRSAERCGRRRRVRASARATGTSSRSTRSTSTVGDGEFFTLLGPSGSGKTTTLRMIAGFEQPDAGTRRRSAARTSRSEPPYSRDVNTVFQDYALFPHMTVAENVGYGLQGEGRRRGAERRAQVDEVLDDGAARRLRRAQAGAALGRPAPARRARARRSSTGRRCCCSTSRSARST